MHSGRGGKRQGAGRPKGSPSRRSKKIEELLEEMDCDPIRGMARIAAMAEQDAQGVEEPKERLPHLNQALLAYKELAQYVAPKRKAIEHSQDPDNPLMTEDQIDARLARYFAAFALGEAGASGAAGSQGEDPE